MAEKIQFPVTMEHDKVKGTTTASSPSSLKVLKKNGWKPKAEKKQTPAS